MLRRKYLAGNLKREKEKTIVRYFESFLPLARDARGRIFQQNDSVSEGSVVKKNANAVRESTNKEIVDTGIEESSTLQVTNKSVAIKLTTFDNPGTSNSAQYTNKKISKPGPSKVKSIESKATQMRQTQSAQRLQDDDDIEDDSSFVEEADNRQKYILIGWDNFRSKIMLFLLVLFILWAAIYFPLIGT